METANPNTKPTTPRLIRADGGRRVRWWGVVQLTHLAPAHLRWHWDHESKGGKHRSFLVSPRGRRWRIKLAHGAWITPIDEAQRREIAVGELRKTKQP